MATTMFKCSSCSNRPLRFNSLGHAYKHQSRLVIFGNLSAWSEQSTATTNLHAPLLRLMLSLATAEDTTWSSVDITSPSLNADIHDEDNILVNPATHPCQINMGEAQCGLASQEGRIWTSEAPQFDKETWPLANNFESWSS